MKHPIMIFQLFFLLYYSLKQLNFIWIFVKIIHVLTNIIKYIPPIIIIEKVDSVHLPTPENTCPICFEDIGDVNNCITSCGHSFCCKCLLVTIKRYNNCPICRTPLVTNDSSCHYNDNEDDGEDEDEEYDNENEDGDEDEYEHEYEYEAEDYNGSSEYDSYQRNAFMYPIDNVNDAHVDEQHITTISTIFLGMPVCPNVEDIVFELQQNGITFEDLLLCCIMNVRFSNTNKNNLLYFVSRVTYVRDCMRNIQTKWSQQEKNMLQEIELMTHNDYNTNIQ